MRRPVAFLLFVGSALAAAAADPDTSNLQGVWHSPPDAKPAVRVIVMKDKVGYVVGGVAADPPQPRSTFVALSDAKLKEAGGKTVAELEIAAGVTRTLELRPEKDGLALAIDKKEYRVRRANTTAADPAAKAVAGAWAIASVSAKGQTVPAKLAGLESLAFAGDRYVVKGPGGKELLSSFYRLGDEKDGRRELDVFGMKADPSIRALVEVKGDDLALAQPIVAASARPTGFDTADGKALVIKATRGK